MWDRQKAPLAKYTAAELKECTQLVRAYSTAAGDYAALLGVLLTAQRTGNWSQAEKIHTRLRMAEGKCSSLRQQLDEMYLQSGTRRRVVISERRS